MAKQDSHFANGSVEDQAPLPQHHRLAMGKPVNGETNPNGAECAPRDNKIAGQRKTY